MNYYKIKALSNSGMNALARSPAHYLAWMESNDDTPAMSFGRAVHAAILEPEVFDNEYSVESKSNTIPGNRLIVDGKLSAREYDAICEMQRACSYTGLITGDFEREMFWTDMGSGAECKGKADIISGNMIWDIKTTNDASDFARSIKKYNYDRQAAFYLYGAKMCGYEVDNFGFIVVEKTPPYGVRVIVASEQTIFDGIEKYKPLAALYARCQLMGEWPSYSHKMEVI